jgi:hypothetical protein
MPRVQRKGKDLNTPLVKKKDIDPCPFCGIKKRPFVLRDWIKDATYAWHYTYTIQCTGVKCKAKGPEKTTQAAAIIAWNNRVVDNGDERVRLSFARDGM